MFPLGASNQTASDSREAKGRPIMGDKSPKSVHKQAAQKQAKIDSANQKKRQDTAAKQVVFKKK